ncbi:MAG: type VI secretion system tip protein VgrG [Chitinivibrionales bacterium]|nr:type VI secretion system tip protein VgrG [Chitinivibrionales bacterium]
MKRRKANEGQFFFFCSGQATGTFEVMNFNGRDAISTPYHFDITLISKQEEIKPEDIVNKQASLFIYRDEEFYPYSGIVTEFLFVDRNTDYCVYNVKLAPRLWMCQLNKHTRVFQKMTVVDIIKQVLDDVGLSDYYDVQTGASYSERDYVVQYQESDLNFISRLMEEYGIWYFFKESTLIRDEMSGGEPSAEKLVIADAPAAFEYIPDPSAIIYKPQTGMVEREEQEDRECLNRLHVERNMVPANVTVKNYNYKTPEVQLTAEKAINDGNVGAVYEFGGHYLDTSEAQKHAEIHSNRIAAQQLFVRGHGSCRAFRAGARFETDNHVRADLNGKYVITQVIHSGSHFAGAQDAHMFSYSNQFKGVPAQQAESFRPEIKTQRPRITGITSAMIETEGSEYAALDDTGHYKARMIYDISDAKNYNASKYIRLAQPYSGADYGIHFPGHEGTEMIVGHVDGDPDRPLGLGTVPHANTISPVKSANKEQSIIRTAGGNEIVMDDMKDKQKVSVKTNGLHALEMDDDKKRAFLTTTNQNKVLLDDANEMASWNAGDHNIKMTYKGGSEGVVITTAGGHVINIDDKNKSITIQSSAGHAIQMDDSGKSISLSDCNGKNTVTLDGSKGLILDSQGKISINAMQDLEIKAANIKMQASTGKIDAKATTDLNLSGMNVSAKAQMDAALEGGMNVNMKGNMKAAIEGGMSLEAKSNVQTKISGTMTEVSGSGMCTIKGGVVMIN